MKRVIIIAVMLAMFISVSFLESEDKSTLNTYEALACKESPGEELARSVGARELGTSQAQTCKGNVCVDYKVNEDILRFHVLANSDSEKDQQLKMNVKDHLAEIIALDMKQAKIESKEDAMEYLHNNINKYIRCASKIIKEMGYNYSITAKLERHWFPVKEYGGYVFPEGEYDAFRVIIGKGEGKNWWCVLFPSLCMVEEAYYVPKEEPKTDNADNDTYKFRIVEWLRELW